MNLITLCSTAVIIVSLLCVAIGVFRGWKHSLIRFGIVMGCFLLSLFIGPLIASALMKRFVNGFVLTAFSFEINFEDMAGNIINDKQLVEDLFAPNSTTANLTSAIMNVLLNVVIFLVLFISLFLISLLIYVIISAVIRRGQEKKKEENRGKYWGLKAVGGFIGLLGGVLICFAFLTPLFGAMNICNRFLNEAGTSASASAATTSKSYVSGKLYYTDDEKIGKVESYIETYGKFKDSYDGSFMGKTFNFFGLSKLGAKTFGHLTNVKSNGLKLNLTNELVSLIKVYNAYKDTFVEQKFNLANQESVEDLKVLYASATESEVAKSYIVEIVPKISERWRANEAIFGIKIPVSGDFKELATEFLDVFYTNSYDRIDENIKVLFGAITVANENELIVKMQEKVDLVTYLEGNDSFIKDEVVELTKSEDIKVVLPNVLNCFMTIAHKELVGIEKDYNTDEYDLTQQQMESLNWKTEAQTLQDLTDGILKVYSNTKNSANASALTGCLKDIGSVIDSARKSTLVSKQLKVFIVDYINSKNLGLESITNNINEKWDDPTFKFVDMFGAIEEVSKVAQNIINADGSVDLTNLGLTLENMLMYDSDATKNVIRDILDSDTVAEIVGNSDEAVIMTDLLDNLLDCEDLNEVGAGIAAAQEIVNIVDGHKNGSGIALDGETQAEKEKSAKTIIETIGASGIVMDMLLEESQKDDSKLENITSNVGGDAEILKSQILLANIDDADKNILLSLFA